MTPIRCCEKLPAPPNSDSSNLPRYEGAVRLFAARSTEQREALGLLHRFNEKVDLSPHFGGNAMSIRAMLGRKLIAAVAVCLLAAPLVTAADDPPLTKEQIKEFLLTAKIISAKESNKGITHPVRLTLSDGKLTHDASYQRVNEHKPTAEM